MTRLRAATIISPDIEEDDPVLTPPRHPLQQLDRILRGDLTRPGALRNGTVPIDAGSVGLMILVLGFVYGACMGCYALFRHEGSSFPQFLTTIGKVPLLFGMTFLITFPSLYVFNALVGSRLNLRAVAQLVLSGLAVMLTILASLGPIVAFFSLSTTSYKFMLLLNVAIFSIAGFLGLRFLLITLHRLTAAQLNIRPAVASPAPVSPTPASATPASAPPPYPPYAPNQAATPEAVNVGPLERMNGEAWERNVARVFLIWTVVFGLVGSQMAWVLRPFLGNPATEFAFFRLRESNFFEAILRAMNL